MSKTRKLLSIAVAVAMLLSVLAVGVFAGIGYSDDTDAAHTQVWSLSTPVDNGDGTYSVDVSLTTTYATGAIEFMIENTDTAVAELSDAVAGAALPFDADVTFSYTTGKVMIIPVTSGKTFLPGAAIDGVIATLTFDYAGEGSATINIEENAKSTTNVGGTLIAAYAENLLDGSVKVGQAATFVDNSQVIGTAAGEAPTLAVIDGTNGVIDDTQTLYKDPAYLDACDAEVDGYIYGVEVADYETVDAVFEVIGDGYMSIVANENGCECGTGTLVEVYDNDDNLVATYALVVFGDLNGDGYVDSDDAALTDSNANWLIDTYGEDDYSGQIENELLLFAGDIDYSGSVDSDDGALMDMNANWIFESAFRDDGQMSQLDVISLF